MRCPTADRLRGARLNAVAAEPSSKPWYKTLFEQGPMTNHEYGVFLVLVLLAVPLFVLQFFIGFAWWMLLFNATLLMGWVSIAYRERQRRRGCPAFRGTWVTARVLVRRPPESRARV